jgi:hypothetical protein
MTEYTPEQINIGSKVVMTYAERQEMRLQSILGGYMTPMTHSERQEWWGTSELGKRLGVDVGEAE